jgi:oligopeptide transport system permease protein
MLASAPISFAAQRTSGLLKLCLGLLLGLALLCLFGPLLSSHDPQSPDWTGLSQAPSSGHWLGTDAIGRDVLTRSLVGGRLSLGIGFGAAFIALLIGLGYGATAGYIGGLTERLMMRVLDVLSALPFLLLVILLLTLFERSLLLLLAAIGGYVWIDLARIVRAEAARLRSAAFIDAARVAGASSVQILRWHLIPNLLPLALVYLGLLLPQAILVESFLGFLGLSVDEPALSWGGLLAEGVQELDESPWVLIVPAVLLCTTLGAFQFLGDALRERWDPTRR